MSYSKPSLSTIEREFGALVEAVGGSVEEAAHYSGRYFARAVAPGVIDYKPEDGFRGGVAVQASVEFAEVQPYLFRLICKNGAIMARALPGFRLTYSEHSSESEIFSVFRRGVEKYWSPGVFAALVGRLVAEETARKLAGEEEVNRQYERWFDPLRVVPEPSGSAPAPVENRAVYDNDPRLAVRDRYNRGDNREKAQAKRMGLKRTAVPTPLVREMSRRFHAAKSRSSFAAMNAVTSVARDLDSPALKWKLEELGGAVGVGLAPPPFSIHRAASVPLAETIERAPLLEDRFDHPADADAMGELVSLASGVRST